MRSRWRLIVHITIANAINIILNFITSSYVRSNKDRQFQQNIYRRHVASLDVTMIQSITDTAISEWMSKPCRSILSDFVCPGEILWYHTNARSRQSNVEVGFRQTVFICRVKWRLHFATGCYNTNQPIAKCKRPLTVRARQQQGRGQPRRKNSGVQPPPD